MLFKWLKRREIQKDWEAVILHITDARANAPVDEGAKKEVLDTLSKTMLLYSEDNVMNKQTIRLLFHLKRILADKRAFDTLKIIEYTLAADGVVKKGLNKDVRQRLAAHYLQMAQSYTIIASRGQKSNPFAPGQVIGGEDDGRN